MSENKKHYFFKLLTNIVKIPIFFLLESYFPRLLGPKLYGDYNFLNDSMTKIIGFFDSGSSIGFYTKFSSNIKDNKLLKSYWIIVFLFSFFFILSIFLSIFFHYNNYIWPDQHIVYVFLAAFFSLITFYTTICSKILDATRLTILSEKMRMIQMIISIFVFILVFFLMKKINLEFFYSIQIILISLLLFGSSIIMNKHELTLVPNVQLNIIDHKKYLNYFYKYSKPFFVYSFFTSLFGLFERWLLQYFSGSIEQAYIGLAIKVGSFIFIFSSAMIPILMREIAKSFSENNTHRIIHLFTNNYKVLFLLSTLISCIIYFNADFVVMVLGGKQYVNAVIVVKVLSIYPVYQTIGQINSSVYYTTNRVKTYTNICISVLPISILINYFLIAPKIKYGLNLGAFGLAIQMLLTQFLVQNILLFFNTKYFKIPYYKLFSIQIFFLLIIFCTGYFIQYFLNSFHLHNLLQLIIFSASLMLNCIIFIYLFPKVLGFETRNAIFKIFK
jgi:O-antigen/teichoic acid export membrane protein